MKIIEEYNEDHGLRFSTDPNPAKSKTKCIAWLNDKRTLPNIILSGNQTPWVGKIRHLGNTITNNSNTMAKDMEEKRAKYIVKCNEIIQYFSLASARTKFKLNCLYNMSWYGSALWDLSSEEFMKLESSYNRSVKIIFDLPYNTHRYLIEPITGSDHLRKIIFKRYLKFVLNLAKSSKPINKTLNDVCKDSSQSSTGRNLRTLKILMETFDEIVIDHTSY